MKSNYIVEYFILLPVVLYISFRIGSWVLDKILLRLRKSDFKKQPILNPKFYTTRSVKTLAQLSESNPFTKGDIVYVVSEQALFVYTGEGVNGWSKIEKMEP